MQTLTLPHTNLKISRLCAGCMGLGGSWDDNDPVTSDDEQLAVRFIEGALEVGINFFDHADIYTRGKAETVFGRVLRENPGLRDQIVLQTKCGIRWADTPPGAPQRFDFSYDHILASAEASLKRLQTEHLDILLLHRPDALWEGEEIARAFTRLRDSGKVRYFGVSNQNRFQIEALQSYLPFPLVANQIEMSLLHSGFAEVGISFNQSQPAYPNGWEGLIEYCRLKGVSLQAWSPLARGLLAGGGEDTPDAKALATVALLTRLAAERGVTPEAIALAWLLRHPSQIVPVLGTTKPQRLAASAKAVEVALTREEWYRLWETARGNQMP
ncbi:aldo/keto reductase family oxidoreductase [Nibricoccus sp. IMCC34717]|uniref:aldo/keto reductase n=1 Tax=Nibricoccus sp. IMCC34717 TaxID=3034021 RepID=UPI00384B928F